MTKASDKSLGQLHGKLAEVMLKSLTDSDVASELLDAYEDELPSDVIKFLQRVGNTNPALLTAVSKFLKDNDITCVIEDNNDMTELQRLLQQKKNARKRVGNIVPIEE